MATAAEYIESRITVDPVVAIVLGSGLGGFADTIENPSVIHYKEIPDWPQSTAIGHEGKLVAGVISGVPAIVLSGRVHLYEGYSAQQVVSGLRAMDKLGVNTVILTNASGGINPDFTPGRLALITDHINLTGANPLTGPNDEDLGPRFPDMSEAYSKRYREIAREVAKTLNIELPEGVYAAVPGPSYETPAEIGYLRTIGADMVGMSTVLETIAAVHLEMKVLGISCVTNFAAGVTDKKLGHEEVISVGARARDTLSALIRGVIPRLPQ